MRVTWEPSDVKSGLLVTNHGTTAVNNKYMISRLSIGDPAHYSFVALSDGVAFDVGESGKTKAEVVEKLNAGHWLPSEVSGAALLFVFGRSP